MRKSPPVETSFRDVLNVTQSSNLIPTNFNNNNNFNSCFIDELNSDEFNAEGCRPGSDLGRHFPADLNFDFFRGLQQEAKKISREFRDLETNFYLKIMYFPRST